MDIIEAIRSRKSIRGFRKDPVSKETIMDILRTAARAPSGTNAQPWEFTVISGEVLEKICKGNIEMYLSRSGFSPDVPLGEFVDVYRQRKVDLAIEIFNILGFSREDKEKRDEWMQTGFRYFDAPAAIIISADCSMFEARTQFDLGLVTQNICLAALHHGLGTCIEQQGVMFPDVLRKYTSIPESKRITISIAIGYPDWDFPVNKMDTPRTPTDSVTRWYGFDYSNSGV